MHRGVRTPPQARLHPIACLEDGESIQAALMEVINALMRNTIDLKRANLILRALHIAVKNASRVRFDLRDNDVVREIPEYNAAPPDQGLQRSEIEPPLTASEPYDEPSPAKLTAEQIRADNIRADQRRYAAKMQAAVDRQDDIRARLERVAKTLPPRGRVTEASPPRQSGVPTATVHPDGTAHLETATPGSPALTTNPATNPPHTAASASARQAPAPDSMKKKPSMPVKEGASPISARAASSIGRSAPTTAVAPKERKNAAHGASRG
jgi:hypothetical protein